MSEENNSAIKITTLDGSTVFTFETNLVDDIIKGKSDYYFVNSTSGVRCIIFRNSISLIEYRNYKRSSH